MEKIISKLKQEKLDCLGYLYDYKSDYFTQENIDKMKKADPENFVFGIWKEVFYHIEHNEDNTAEFEAWKIAWINFALSLLDKMLDK